MILSDQVVDSEQNLNSETARNALLIYSLLARYAHARDLSWIAGAPGRNRTYDLRFRKPINCVHLDLTSSAYPYFVHNSVQLVPSSPITNLSVCATSVQHNFE